MGALTIFAIRVVALTIFAIRVVALTGLANPLLLMLFIDDAIPDHDLRLLSPTSR